MDSNTETFHWIWVAPSIILGLGLTRLLSNAIVVFKSRSQTRLDWVPILWAGCIFIWQVQYVWAVIELPNQPETWTLLDFTLLLGVSLLLFIAAALILPDSELPENQDLSEYFERDGRWALLALSLWGCAAITANWTLFDASPFASEGVILAGIVALPILFLSIPSRQLRKVVTILNVGLTLWAAWELSPKSY